MPIEIKDGRTGTFRAVILDYAEARRRMRSDPDAGVPELAHSPEFPGTPKGMEGVREWVRNELEARVGPTWRELTADPFMTNDELDRFRPGWRRVPYVLADGTEGIRTLVRPPIDLTLETVSMTCPLRKASDPDDLADIGVAITGPQGWTDEALEAMPSYSEEEIREMAMGRRPWPGRPS